RIFSGNPPNLLADNKYTQKPWAGFTTGINAAPPAPNNANTGNTLPTVEPTAQPGANPSTPQQVAPTIVPTTVAVTPVPSGPTAEPTRVQDLGIITPKP